MYDPVRTKSFARSRLGRSIITSLILHDTEFRAVARDMLSSLELCSQSQFPNRSVSCFLRTGMHPVRPEPRQDIVALLKSQDTFLVRRTIWTPRSWLSQRLSNAISPMHKHVTYTIDCMHIRSHRAVILLSSLVMLTWLICWLSPV
jgi:hypothetical protein